MRRSIPLVLVPLFLFALPPAASAGGSCRGATLSDAPATVVEMEHSCFGPIVSRVEAGGTLTFVNNDGEVHGVGGIAGTFGEMHEKIAPGDSVRFTFEEPGVYPFICLFHPGMAGAVVVGDGEPLRGETTVLGASAGGSGTADTGPDAQVADEGSSWTWAGPLLGLGLVSLVAAAAIRRRATRAELPSSS